MPDHDDINLDLPGVGDPPQTAASAETVTAADTADTIAVAATAEPLEDVETLAKGLAVPAWKLAGLMRHQRWVTGKAVTKPAFMDALAAFEDRPLGGGR